MSNANMKKCCLAIVCNYVQKCVIFNDAFILCAFSQCLSLDVLVDLLVLKGGAVYMY